MATVTRGLMWIISNLEGAVVHWSNLIDLQHRQDEISVWKVERERDKHVSWIPPTLRSSRIDLRVHLDQY